LVPLPVKRYRRTFLHQQYSTTLSRFLDTIAPAPLQRLHHYYGSVRPNFLHRYSRLAVVCRLCFSLGISKLVPAVPRKSLHPTHAPYTPATVRPIIRLPTDLSQRKYPPLVLVTIMNSHDASSMGLLSLVFRMRTCPRSCLGLLIRR
jgi:hypothetical protein